MSDFGKVLYETVALGNFAVLGILHRGNDLTNVIFNRNLLSLKCADVPAFADIQSQCERAEFTWILCVENVS